jgi:hypothetical protein
MICRAGGVARPAKRVCAWQSGGAGTNAQNSIA